MCAAIFGPLWVVHVSLISSRWCLQELSFEGTTPQSAVMGSATRMSCSGLVLS